MKLEEIKQIMKQYDDLDAYIQKVFGLTADARGINYHRMENFLIYGDQIEINYSIRACGCCCDDYDSLYFDVDVLTEDLEIVTTRLNAEAEERKVAEAKLAAEKRVQAEFRQQQEERAQLAKLQAKYKT